MEKDQVKGVLLAPYELDDILGEIESLKDQLESRKSSSSKTEEPSDGKITVGLTPEISRPAWISMMYFLAMTRSEPDYDFSPLVQIGTRFLGRIKIPLEESMVVNKVVLKVFGPHGVIVRVSHDVGEDISKDDLGGESRSLTYIPVPGLHVGVRVGGAVENAPWSAFGNRLYLEWRDMDPWTCFSSALGLSNAQTLAGTSSVPEVQGNHDVTGRSSSQARRQSEMGGWSRGPQPKSTLNYHPQDPLVRLSRRLSGWGK